MPTAALSHRTATGPVASDIAGDPDHPVLAQARSRVVDRSVITVTPDEAWSVTSDHAAVLIDVRTAEERKFVGHVPQSVHVPWLLGTAMQTNPRFLRELEARVPKHGVALLICRSGQRSLAAAAAATKAGFRHIYAVLEGFEGDLDQQRQRGQRNGWRFRGLPWIQD